MENNAVRPGDFPGKNSGVVLSPSEAEEFCEYKRQKRIAEVHAALSKSELSADRADLTVGEIRKTAESAVRVQAAAVRVSPLYLPFLRNVLNGKGVAADCIVGGTGETTAKVKAYEAKLALRAGAREITLVLSVSALKNGRTGDTRREIRRVCRKARRALVKVRADKSLTYAEMLRVGKLAADCGAKYLSVSFFPDCGRLKRDLHDGCMLEVTDVETAADYKSLIAAGAERIGTSHAEEIYAELLREAENYSLAVNFAESITVSRPSSAVSEQGGSGTSGKQEEPAKAESEKGKSAEIPEKREREDGSRTPEKPVAEKISAENDRAEEMPKKEQAERLPKENEKEKQPLRGKENPETAPGAEQLSVLGSPLGTRLW